METTVTSLKAHLSENLRRVAQGETVVVTDRRKPVAQITAYEGSDLVESAARGPFAAVHPKGLNLPVLNAQALLNADRGDH